MDIVWVLPVAAIVAGAVVAAVASTAVDRARADVAGTLPVIGAVASAAGEVAGAARAAAAEAFRVRRTGARRAPADPTREG